MENPPLPNPLRAAGEFFPIDQHIVPAAELYRNPQPFQGCRHRLTKQVQIQFRRASALSDQGEIQISQVMVNRPASGSAPYHPDAPGPGIIPIQLCFRILVAPYNDGVVVLPQKEPRPLSRLLFK